MYAVIIEDVIFNSGYAFNQLISVEGSLSDAVSFINEFLKGNPQFKHHSIIIKEIFIDDIENIDLKAIVKRC